MIRVAFFVERLLQKPDRIIVAKGLGIAAGGAIGGNFVVLDALLVRILIPATAVGVAVIAAQRGWGLLNITPWPPVLEPPPGFSPEAVRLAR